MKLSAAVLLLATLARESAANCITVQVYANDQGAWASHGLTNEAVFPNLQQHIAAVPYLCPWEGPFLTEAESLKAALSQSVGILIALATSDVPIWTKPERKLVMEAMRHKRLGYLMVYDWISYTGTTDRFIPGLPATFVAPGHSQVMNAIAPGTAPSEGPDGNITAVASPACWATTGAIAQGLSKRHRSRPQFTGESFYEEGKVVTSVVDYRVPKAKTRVYYSTEFVWVFLTGASAQPAWCIGSEPADTLLTLFNNELTYVAQQLVTPLMSIDYSDEVENECPEVVATISWVPENKKFLPLNLIQDPDDPVDLALTISITSCKSSEYGKAKLGKDCHVDEIDESLIYLRASKHNKARLYAVSYFATNDQGISCTGTVYACVPRTDYNNDGFKPKPDGKGKNKACPTPDAFEEWTEQLEEADELNREAWDISVKQPTTTSTTSTAWQWSIMVALSATTLVVAVSTLATICFQMRSNWLTLKEEAFTSALVMSPCQMQRASPTPAV